MILLLCIFVGFALTGCNDDDDDEDGGGNAKVGTVSGVVDDGTRAPIEGAQVYVNGLSDITDVNGRYSIPNILIGTYTLKVVKGGYQIKEESVTVLENQDTQTTVVLVPKVWGTEETLESDTNNADDCIVAWGPNGTAISVWEQTDGTNTNLWASHYDGTSWGTPVSLEGLPGDSDSASIAIDNNGNAHVAWEQGSDIYAVLYTNGVGWGASVLIESLGGTGNEPHVGVDNDGNATAVWVHNPGSGNSVYASRYVPGVGWGTPQDIDNDASANSDVSVGFNGLGHVIAVWIRGDGVTTGDVMAARYVNGSWGTPQKISTSGVAEDPHISVNDSGYAAVIWTQANGANTDVWGNYFDGSSWGTAINVQSAAGAVDSPKVGLASMNNTAIGVWGRGSDVWAARYSPSAWTTPTVIESSGSSVDKVNLAMDRYGNALVVWEQADNADIWSNYYAYEVGWGTPRLVESAAGSAREPVPAVNEDGDAIIVWYQSDGTRNNIWAAVWK